ncbi:hypothetical protein [Latilactobacillus curvatus]|uniref:hypothetical protein n=1 Tax=Latilactobacillus curvatus TaxID=28038 RepID=UPI002449252F|nr:hypothetical protein [Latilactobacillus curvatus]
MIDKVSALQAISQLRTVDAGFELGESAIEAIRQFKQSLIRLAPLARQVWHQQRRGNGYEIMDIRLGGQLMRADTVIWRISEWQAGRDALLELKEPVLPMDKKSNGLVGHGLYQEIVSAGDISF